MAESLLVHLGVRIVIAEQGAAGKRDILIEAEPTLRERVLVKALDQAMIELYSATFGQPRRHRRLSGTLLRALP